MTLQTLQNRLNMAIFDALVREPRGELHADEVSMIRAFIDRELLHCEAVAVSAAAVRQARDAVSREGSDA